MWSMDFYQTLHPKAISPMLSSKVLQVYILYLTYDLSWVFFVIWVLRCIFFCYHNLLKRWSFPERIVFAPLSSINWPYLDVAISGFSILSCWSVSILSPWQHHSLDYCTWVTTLEIGQWFLQLYSFISLHILLSQWGKNGVVTAKMG